MNAERRTKTQNVPTLRSAFCVSRSAFISFSIIAITTLAMLAWSWQTWPDPLVDYGTQLYVPWQMTMGRVLYRDLAIYNGPLSQYLDAGLFTIFGVSMRTFVFANLAIIAAVLILIYRLAMRTSGTVAATACGVTFVLLFAFGQGVGVGNFNWVTPYTYEITHGIALGLLTISLLEKYRRSGKRAWLIASGVVLGLTFLTKAEPFVATLCATVAMLIAGAWMNRRSTMSAIVDAVIFYFVTAAIPLIAFLLMSLQMPMSIAARGVAGSWPWLFDRRVTALPFYRKISGTDDVTGNLLAMMRWSLVYAVALGGAILIGLRMRRRSRAAAIIVFVVAVAAMAICSGSIDWGSIIRPLPICLLVMLAITIVAVVRRTMSVDLAVIRMGAIVFAIVLVSKIAINVGIPHYGFALAMPGVLLMTAAVFEGLASWVRSRGGDGGLVRAIGIAGWFAAVVVTLYVDQLFFAQKHWTFGENGDTFRVDRRGVEIGQLVTRIQQLTPEHSTLAVLPQGLMVNYLSRRADAIPYLNFMPPEVLAVGEDRIIAALEAQPPDAIVIDAGSVSDGDFTMDQNYHYGRATLAWVRRNYKSVGEIKSGGLVLMLHDQLTK